MLEVADFRVQLFVFCKWHLLSFTMHYNLPVKKMGGKALT